MSDFFRQLCGLEPSEIEATDHSLSGADTAILLNTRIHQFALKYGSHLWVHGRFDGESPESKGRLIENAQSRHNFVSAQIGEFLNPGSLGNGLVTVELDTKSDLS
jgi:hypothetical protein